MSDESAPVAVVTGGSRGIGLAIAEELARGGSTVAVLARGEAGAKEAAAGLPGSGHRGYACDVSDASQVEQTARQIRDDLGDVGVLVNNAGITRDSLVMRLDEEAWNQVLDVNLKGAFYMTKAFTRSMMKRRDGVILNITSVVGIMGNAGQANYAASKAGLIGLTKSVARELASRGVRCNAIAPGYIETEMTADLGEGAAEALKSQIPLGRLGEPADVAGLVGFLAGPAARYITGQVIAVDGGMAM